MKKDFLKYLLFITLVEIREHSYETGNNRFFWLTDLLHNVPMQLESDSDAKEAYHNLIITLKS